MKTNSAFFAILLIILASLFSGAAASQEQSVKKKNLPKPILESFAKSYPNGIIKACSKEKDDGKWFYEIESVEGKINRDITYNPDGSVVSVEETLPFGSVPAAVRNSLEKDFPKHKVTKSEKVMTGAEIQYEFVVKSGKETLELVFDKAGKLVKKEKLSAKKDKD